MALGKYIRTEEHDKHISDAKKAFYANLENRIKHRQAQLNREKYDSIDYNQECVKRKGVLYYRFACVDCGALHYAQKIKEQPRNPYCTVCAARLRSIGRVFPPEVKAKISASLMGHKGSCGMLGKKHSAESIRKRTATIISRYGKYPSYKKGHYATEETKRKMSVAAKKRWQSKEYRLKQIERLKKMWQDPNSKVNSLEYREFREEVLWRMFKKAPKSNYNGKEQCLDKLLQRICPDQYKYNGAGNLGFKIFDHTPDFVNVNGRKKLINMNGCVWHCCKQCGLVHPMGRSTKSIRTKDRNAIKYAKVLGYKMLVIWEHELKDEDTLITKIIEFNKV